MKGTASMTAEHAHLRTPRAGRPLASFLLAAAVNCAAFGGTVYAPEDAPRDVRFANPPAASRILPIQHGQPNEPAKVDAVLADLEADGFGGFTGNVNFADYLDSPVDWAAFRHKVEAAHARGLAVWLYDEKGYPSGTAGGKTLEGHPEWRARAYLVAVTNVPAGSAARPPRRYAARRRTTERPRRSTWSPTTSSTRGRTSPSR